MKLLLAIAAVLVTAQGATLLGQDKCTWGPSYWCSSLEASSQCDTFQHCLDTVWKQKIIAVHQTEVCLLAQKVVNSVRHVLNENDGKEEASHLVAAMCPLVRDDDMRKQCKKMVSGYLPEVFIVIDSDVDAATASVTLGFCQPRDDKQMSNEVPLEAGPYYPPTNKTICNDCKAFINDMRGLLNQPGAETKFVEVAGDIICSKLGDLTDLCKALMEVELPNAFKFLAENDNPETLCRLGTFCIDTVDSDKPKLENILETVTEQLRQTFYQLDAELEKGLMCHECQKMLAPVVAMEKDSPFRLDVEHAIAYLCAEAGIPEDKCEMIAEGFIPKELGEILSRDFNANNVCKFTLRCIPDTVAVAPTPSAALTPIPMEPPTHRNEVHASNQCTDCIHFFNDVKAILRDNISAPEAAAMAKQSLCQSAGPLEYECNDMMDVFMPVVLNYLASVDSPPRVCGDLTLCTKSPAVAKFELVKYFDQAWEKKHLGNFECDECATLVQEARDLDREANFQKGLVDFFNELCAKLGNEANQCKSLVQQYAPMIFEVIASELEPDVVCELLLRCTKPEAKKEDEPVIQAPVETVNIVAEIPAVQERPIKKSKKNSAIYKKHELLMKKSKKNSSAYSKKEEEKKEKEVPKQRVKEAVEVKVGESVECAICRLAMESIDDVIAANATQQEVEKGLKDLCKILPSSVKQPCDDFINEYTPVLVDLILQQLDPFLICKEIGVCNGTETQLAPFLRAAEELHAEQKMMEKEDKPVKSTFECDLCELIVGYVDRTIGSNRSEEAIQKALDGICDILPSSIRPQCHSFVDEYSVVVVQLLLQEMDPEQVCIFIGVCPPNNTKSVVPPPAVGEKPFCTICELVLGEVDTIIGSNRSEPAVKHALDNVCSLFPATISTECARFVDSYAPAIINLLVQEIDPHKICKLLGLCDLELDVHEEPDSAPEGPLCSLCEIVINEVDIIIGSNKSEPAVQNALDQVCGKFPETIRDECVDFVNKYAPAVINLLVQELDPKKVCKVLGLCDSTEAVELPLVRPTEFVEETDPEAGPLCTLCDEVLDQLDKLLGSNRTEAGIEKALDQVCTFFPPNKTALCVSIIDLYAPAIVNLLVQEIRPKDICKRLGLCAAFERVPIDLPVVLPEEKSQPQEGDDVYCELCKIIIKEINNILKDNRSDAALIHAVETVCDVVSGDLKLQCKSEVENYGPAVLDLLRHMDDPQKVCKAIKVCFNANDSEKKKKSEVELTPGEECLICQTLANYAGEALRDGHTEDEIVKLLKDVCTLLPASVTDTCDAVVEKFTPMVLEKLAEEDNPLHLCQDIDMCAKDPTHIHKRAAIVGADPCTYGPAYWCASMQNAKQCQVVEECIQKYGMTP